jgi:DNA-binding PadR family transcriptional regulator
MPRPAAECTSRRASSRPASRAPCGLPIVTERDYDAPVPRRSPEALLPLKPFVFEILVVLATADRHGWSLLRALETRTGGRVLPGQLYRQIDALLADGLIDERDRPRGLGREMRDERVGGAAPRRFFRLTPFGRSALTAEARRLEGLVSELRTSGLLPSPRQS